VDGVRSRSTATNPQTVLEETQPVAATVVATAAYTGLRKSELRGLRWMDLEGNQLRIQRTVWNTHIEDKTKTPNSRAPVPLVPMLQRLLESHRNGFPQDGFIFAGEKKKKQPLNLSNLARRVIVPALDEARAAKKTDVEWHGWHAFRRGLATNLYAIQTPENVIQDIMRHADVKITRKHYIKMTPESSQRAMDSLEKLFASLEQKKK
jgi:integrase